MKTLEPYRQVLLTYLDRIAFRVMFFVVLFGGGGYYLINWLRDTYHRQLFLGSALRDPALGVFFFIDFLAYFLPFVLLIVFVIVQITHLREQLIQPQAQLLPRYRAPHLLVGAVVFFCAGGLAALITFAINWMVFRGDTHPDLLGTIAFTLALMTLTAWIASVRSPWFAAAIVPLLMLASQQDKLNGWFNSFLNYHWERNWGRDIYLLALDLLALFILFNRFSRLSISSDSKPRRGRARAKTEADSRQHPRPHAPHSATLVRAWHRRAGVLPRGAAWAVAIVLFLLLSFVTSVARPSPSDLLRSLVLATIIPGVVISFSWLQRWRNLAGESLFPGQRNTFIRELALANAIDLAEFWIATMIAVLLPVLIWNPAQLQTPLLPIALAASAAMQVLVFGGVFLSATSRPSLPYSTVAILLATLIPLAFAWGEEPTLTPHGLALVSTIEMFTGVLLAACANSAWRKVDFA